MKKIIFTFATILFFFACNNYSSKNMFENYNKYTIIKNFKKTAIFTLLSNIVSSKSAYFNTSNWKNDIIINKSSINFVDKRDLLLNSEIEELIWQDGDKSLYKIDYEKKISDVDGYNQNAMITPLNGGKYFAVWENNKNENFDIYGAIFDLDSNRLTSEIIINGEKNGNQVNPYIITLSNDNVFIAWEGNQTGKVNIYGKIFDSQINIIKGDFKINDNHDKDLESLVSTLLSNGNFMTAYIENFDSRDSRVYAKVFTLMEVLQKVNFYYCQVLLPHILLYLNYFLKRLIQRGLL